MKKFAAFSVVACALATTFSVPGASASQSISTSQTVYAERLVPAGTSLDVTFLTGVDTTTDIQTSNPAPALLSISDIRQVVPESAQKEIGSCVAVVAGVADDKAASRVYFRASSLRCLDAQGNYAYEANLEGYLVGQGGKLGISRSGVERGEQAQLVLTRDTGVFSPRQLGHVPSQR